jgi:PAS domain S-box-containing protein
MCLKSATDKGDFRANVSDRRDSQQHDHHLFQAAPVSLWEEDISELCAALDTPRQHGVTDFRVSMSIPVAGESDTVLVNCMDVTKQNRAEKALRERERRLQAIVDVSGDVFFELDRQGVVTYCSPPIERIRTFAPAERFIGTHFSQHFVPDQREIAESGFKRALSGQAVKNLRLQVFDRQGASALIEVDMAPISTEERIVGVMGILRDVSERILLEQKLQESEGMIRALLNASTEAMVLLDLDGTLLALNEATARSLNRSVTDLTGKCVYDFFPVDVARARKANTERVIRLKSPQHIEDERGGRFFDSHVYPIFDSRGEVVRVAVFSRDITERVRYTRRLQQAHQEILQRNRELTVLNRVAETFSQPYSLRNALSATLRLVLDTVYLDGGIIQLAGKSKNLPSYVTYGDLAFFPQQEQLFCLAERVQGEMIQSARSIWTMDSAHLPDLGTPVWQEDGTVVGFLVQAHEKPQGVMLLFSRQPRALSEAQVRLLLTIAGQLGTAVESAKLADGIAQIELANELDHLRSKLIANVSHELRTPLGLIEVGCSSLLTEDVTYDRETQIKFLRMIEQETANLSGLVDNLLGLSRVESGEFRLYKQPVDVRELVRDTVDRIELVASAHLFTCELPAGPLRARVDAYACEQVLYNLLSNAIKYSPPGTEITVRATAEDQEVLVQVRDQGIGIPTQEMDHVFERFFRGQHEQVRRAGGTGLGLPVCKELVQAHGGRIWLESTPNAGTSAFFTLPIGDVRG